jgi:magnesium transporter
MSADAPPARPLPPDELDITHLPEGQQEERARITAYAETHSGVHAIGLDDALQMFERCRNAKSAEDADAPLVWIDVACPGEPEAEFLRHKLHFHPLAVEDCIRGRQRPKLDRYPGYYFLVFYAAAINKERQRMALHEVHVFLGRRYIVTVHDHRIPQFGEVLARWRAAPVNFRTVGAIAHAIVDTIVDGYFPILDHFAERVDEIETGIFKGTHTEPLEEILGIRRELTTLRRVLGPERELLGTLLRRDLPFLSPELLLYFQDVYDHSIRVVEETENLRDLLGVSIEAQLSVASNQLNTTMRVMAAWSIILMAMAWIAGIYGMNFSVMPELRWHFGYLWALAIMAVVGLSLFYYFRRKHWI